MFRSLTAAALVAAATAHVPVIREHLREAPYMGVAFIGFVVMAMLFAIWVASTAGRVPLVATIVVCASAICMYALTRTVAFPELADDVGNWSERLGVISVATESIAIVAASLALLLDRRPAPLTGFVRRPARLGAPIS